MAKKKKETKKKAPPTCGTCMTAIDEKRLQHARENGLKYVHWCGRVLVHGDMP